MNHQTTLILFPNLPRPRRSLIRHRMPRRRHALSLGDLQGATAVHRQYQSRKRGKKRVVPQGLRYPQRAFRCIRME